VPDAEHSHAGQPSEDASYTHRYREITALISDAVYSFHFAPDGTLLAEWGVETFTKITGYQPDELDLSQWERLLHPDDVPVMQQRLAHFQQGLPAISEYRVITKAGEVRWLHDHGRPVWDEDTGHVLRIYGAVQDITARKQAEAELLAYRDQLADLVEQRTADLRASEARYRLLADHATDLISRHSPDGTYLYASPAALPLLGYTPEELIGSSSTSMFHPDDLASTGRTLAQVLASSAPMRSQYRVIRKDGRVIWLETTGQAIRDPQSGAVVEVIAVSRDCTVRVEMEAALRESEQRYRSIFNDAPLAIGYADTDGRIQDANPAYLALFGYRLEELQRLTFADFTYPDDQTADLAQFQRMVVGEIDQYHLDKRFVRQNGQIVWTRMAVSLVRDSAGAPQYVIGMIEDITERKRIETRLLQQQHAMAMLRERERLARELHDTFGQVLGYVNTQSQTIRTLLASGQTALAEMSLDTLTAVTQETATDLREFILGVRTGSALTYGFFPSIARYLERYEQIYSITTSLDVPSALHNTTFAPMIEAHLVRIIQEALTNARKHANPATVRVTFAVQAEQVRLVVEDDGSGFHPTPQAEAVTDEHYGLSSMRERTREMGGTMQLDSTPGAGTRVIVHVPLHLPDTLVMQRMTVLLVDDQPLFLEGMENMLTTRGITVIATARNGQEALEQARLHRPDIILMDVEMPVCNGLEATRRIKAELPDSTIVMLTVSDQDEYLFEAIKAGAAGYLLKNLDASDFFNLLAEVEQGEVALSPELAKRLMHEFARSGSDSAPTTSPDQAPADAAQPEPSPESDTPEIALTNLQRDILALAAQGYTYREVGERVGYSERSIKTFMSQIIKQLHLRNRAAAIAYARQQGLVP
jgi:PAS domain S-box-containing protein